ncbi:MAG TPA: hypothetical protein VII45_12610 [Solirubrobacterales bacterium]
MRGRIAILAAVAAAAVALVLVLVLGGGTESKHAATEVVPEPVQPGVDIVSPRNGARQASHAVVVKVEVHNFHLSPAHFGGEPELGEGHLRFSLNRVPNCVDPKKLQRALNSPLGNERLVGASFDFPKYSGPNGVLAERIHTVGSYSPATRPEIFYHDLEPGFYRLVIDLAENNGAQTQFHGVTNFQILPRPGHGPKPCPSGKVSTAKAATAFD